MPGSERESWKRFREEALPRFLNGTYRGGSIRLVADLNEQIMKQLADEILATRLRIKGAPIGPPGSYACTLRAAHELAALTKVMNEQLNLQTSQAAIDSLEADVQAARNRVSESWPHS